MHSGPSRGDPGTIVSHATMRAEVRRYYNILIFSHLKFPWIQGAARRHDDFPNRPTPSRTTPGHGRSPSPPFKIERFPTTRAVVSIALTENFRKVSGTQGF